MPTIEKTLRAHCNECRRETIHHVVSTRVTSGSDDEQGFYWKTQYDMIQCRGCEDVSLRRILSFSEDEGPTTEFFPPRVSRWLPNWKSSLPVDISGLLCEVYRALQSDSRLLALMGARTLIERSMIRKVGKDQGSFTRNLQALEKEGHVSCRNRGFLEAALEAGHAASHRAISASPDDVNTVMDIVENMLQSMFALEKRTEALKARTPIRPRDGKAKPPSPVPPLPA